MAKQTSNVDESASAVTTPIEETPVVETPIIETPVVETPIVETQVIKTPVIETPIVEPEFTAEAETIMNQQGVKEIWRCPVHGYWFTKKEYSDENAKIVNKSAEYYKL